MQQLKKEHRAALVQQARGAQYHMDAMTEKVYFLEGRLGLRPLTAAETQAQQAAEAQTPRPKKIGLRHYDESAPTGRVVMLACARRGETSGLRAA